MPKIVNKPEKKEKLAQSAIPIFAKHGFRETKMSDVAISADVGKGTLYEYYVSKDELFLTVFRIWFSYFSEQMQEIIGKERNPRKQLLTFFEQFFTTIEQYSEMYYIYFDFWSELTRNPALNKQEMMTVYQSLREMFSGVLEDGIDHKIFRPMETSVISAGLLAISDGLLLQWLIDRTAFSIKEVGMITITGFLDSIAA